MYEAGQFAVRGGIVDIFSYANELPYRIELFGDEVETIRTFDPESQLSVDKKAQVSIIPNVQTKLLQETREAFLDFIPDDTAIWAKDLRQTLDVVTESFERAEAGFQELLAVAGGTQVVSRPEDLFESVKSFKKLLEGFPIVEFGKRFYFQNRRGVCLHGQAPAQLQQGLRAAGEEPARQPAQGLHQHYCRRAGAPGRPAAHHFR